MTFTIVTAFRRKGKLARESPIPFLPYHTSVMPANWTSPSSCARRIFQPSAPLKPRITFSAHFPAQQSARPPSQFHLRIRASTLELSAAFDEPQALGWSLRLALDSEYFAPDSFGPAELSILAQPVVQGFASPTCPQKRSAGSNHQRPEEGQPQLYK